ncbi:MAG: response regulator [Bacteroidota bacterium]
MNKTTHPEINKAFIIDDEADICYLLRSVLNKKQIASEHANTLKEAKVALKGKNPAIIFLDNRLPDGLGVNFIKQIKKEHPASKIIMITAHDNQADREKALDEGADYFMGKPFSREIVNKIVDIFIP